MEAVHDNRQHSCACTEGEDGRQGARGITEVLHEHLDVELQHVHPAQGLHNLLLQSRLTGQALLLLGHLHHSLVFLAVDTDGRSLNAETLHHCVIHPGLVVVTQHVKFICFSGCHLQTKILTKKFRVSE